MKAVSSAILAAMLVALTLVAGSQQIRGGAIEGQLRTPDGEPAVGVRVGVKAVDQLGVDSFMGLIETGADGRYRLEDLPVGRYYLVAGPVGAPFYYPGLDTAEGATIVTVAGATLTGFNFTVDPRRLIAPRPGVVAPNPINPNAPGAGLCFSGVPTTRSEFVFLSADRAGNVFFAEDNGSSVRKLAPDGKVTTVAGNGTTGFSGDRGPATAASLGPVRAIAADPTGNLFIAEGGSPRIRKVTPGGVITTVAGNGKLAFSGDGGPATSAGLCTPTGLAVDGKGNLFIATGMGQNGSSFDDYRVRKVDTSGVIKTVAGNGAAGDGLTPDGGPATSAAIFPINITADAAGNLYILTNGEMVRKVSPDGAISTFAGSRTAGSTCAPPDWRCGPEDGGPALFGRIRFTDGSMATDTRGNLFITNENRIRRINSSGIIETIAGNGPQRVVDGGEGVPATSFALNLPFHDSLMKVSPSRLAVDGAGNVFFGEGSNTGTGIARRIRKVTPDGTLSTVFQFVSNLPCVDPGPGYQRPANLIFLAADRTGNVFFADDSAPLVRKVAPDGTVSVIAGNGAQGFSGDGSPATSASLNRVSALATDASGNLFIAEEGSPRVRKVTSAGTIVTIAGNGKREFSGDGGPAVSASLCDPTGLTVDAMGNVFVASGVGPANPSSFRDNYRIRKIDAAGVITTIIGTGVAQPVSGPSGDALATERVTVARSIAADASGSVYFLSEWGVGRVNPAGQLEALEAPRNIQFPSARLSEQSAPSNPILRNAAVWPGTVAGLAVDGKGNMFFADPQKSHVQKLTADGNVAKVAGNGERSLSSGEGTIATASPLSLVNTTTTPTGSSIAVDGAGNLFIGEIGAPGGQIVRRIRKLTPDGAISTVYSSISSFKISGKVVSAVPLSNHATRAFGGNPEPAAPQVVVYMVALNNFGLAAIAARSPERFSLSTAGAGPFGVSLPAGSYELFAAVPDINGWDLAAPGRDGGANPVAFGRASIVVSGDQTGVAIQAHPGVDLKGRVTIDGRPVSPGGLRIRLLPDAAAAVLTQYQAVGRFSPRIGADGSFTFPSVPEAQYRIDLQWMTGAVSYALKEIRLDGEKVEDTGIAIGVAPPGVLEIIFTTTTGN